MKCAHVKKKKKTQVFVCTLETIVEAGENFEFKTNIEYKLTIGTIFYLKEVGS
jgi:hypothetical protein